MQEYVNVDYKSTMSIVGLVDVSGRDHIIAEARYVKLPDPPYADTAFVVDEEYRGKGLATFLLNNLIRIARERGFKGLNADVLRTTNPCGGSLKKHPTNCRHQGNRLLPPHAGI